MADDDLVSIPRPRRRRDDDELEQIRELLRVESDVVGRLAQRVGRVERIQAESTNVHFEDMNSRQQGAIIPMVDDWLNMQKERQRRRVALETWVKAAAIAQGLTAAILVAVAIYQFFHGAGGP